MAENKKSVLLYCDIIHTVEELNDDEAGRLFKHYLRYINDLNPDAPDKLTKIIFEPIKQTLKRDLKKWEQFVERQSINGKRGGRPHKANETQTTQAFFEKPKKAVSVSVSAIDKDKVIENTHKLFSIEHCMTIALNDERWVKANKANELQLKTFNSFLEQTGEYEKNPGDYKKHFANLKLKNPEKFKTNGKANYKAALQAFRGES